MQHGRHAAGGPGARAGQIDTQWRGIPAGVGEGQVDEVNEGREHRARQLGSQFAALAGVG